MNRLDLLLLLSVVCVLYVEECRYRDREIRKIAKSAYGHGYKDAVIDMVTEQAEEVENGKH